MQVASNPALANPAPVSPPPPPAAPSDPQAAAGPGPNGTPSASDPAATGPGEQPGSYFAGYTKPLIQRPDGTTFAPGPGAPLLDVAAQAVTAFGAQPESFNAMTQPLYLGRASSGLLADLMSGGQPLPTGGDAPWGRPEYVPRPQPALADMGMLSRTGVTTNNKGPLRVDNPDAYFAGTAPGRLQRVPDLVQRQPDGRGSQGEQDAFSGQPGNQDGEQPLPQQADNGPYPPGKDGTPLRAKDPVGVDGPYPPGKDGHPLRATEPFRPPGKDGNPLRATEPSPPTDGQIPESATSKRPEAKPVDPAAPVAAPGEAGAVAPTGPTADPMEIQALELMLADPANKEMVANFGGELKPAVTGNDVADSIVARYGSDLAGRLTQMQTAQQEVQKQYMAALDAAIYSPGAKQPGSMFIGSEYNSALPAGMQGLPLRPGVGPRSESGSWVLDPVAFTNEWSKGDSALQKAFAYLHGNDAVQRVTVGQGETEDTVLAFGRQKLTPAGNRSADDDPDAGTSKLSVAWDHIDPKDPPKLLNNDMVWFDPSRGWVTDPDNLKPDGLDRAMPYVFAAAVTAMTFGAGSTVAAGIASAAGGGTTGTMAVGAAMGAVSNSALQLAANGKINFGQVLKSAVAGGLTAGMTQLPGVGEYLDATGKGFSGRLVAHAGRATAQGALQAAMGGKFGDGFASGIMSGLAGEVTAHLDAQISQMQGLSVSDASALRLLTRATGSAMRLVGTNDPGSAFASDFLGGLMQDGLASHQPLDSGERPGQPDRAASANGTQFGPAAEPAAAVPATVTVASGDTLERLARQQYGENWRAGLTAMVASNPGMTTNRWGSPIIQAGQTLNTPSLDGLGADQLNQLGRVGGEIVAGNTRGLNVRAEYLAQQRAASQRAAAQAAAQQQASGSGGMTPQEAQDRFGGRSGSFARQMGEDHKPVWHGADESGDFPFVTESGGRATPSTWDRSAAHALGVVDAGTNSLYSAGQSFGILGTPESRAQWAMETAAAGVNQMRQFANDPGGTISSWWSNLNSNDLVAVRNATSQGVSVAGGAVGGISLGRLAAPAVGSFGQTVVRTMGPAVSGTIERQLARQGLISYVIEPVSVVQPISDAAKIVTPPRLFHYTNGGALLQILDSGKLNPSLRALNPNDVRYGNGQYFSTITPGSKTPAQLSRLFINNPYQGARYTHFLEIDTAGLRVVMGRPGVFVVPGDLPLDLTGRLAASGRVGEK